MFRPSRAAGRVVRALLLLLIAPVGTGVAREQPPDMVTDRPDQTESAAVVPRGLLQVETGYLFARDGDVDGHAVPGTLFRLGLGGRLELRIGHVGIVGGAGRRGAGDSELGAKINLIARADGWRPELALLSGLSLPTGDPAAASTSQWAARNSRQVVRFHGLVAVERRLHLASPAVARCDVPLPFPNT